MRQLEWSDFTREVRQAAIASTMRIGGLSHEEAEEVVCSAIAKLMQRRPLTRSPQGLLIVASRNMLVTQRQVMASRPALVALVKDLDDAGAAAAEPIDEKSDPVSELMTAEEISSRTMQLRVGLERLAPADRAILSAYYVEGKSLRDMDEERGDRIGAAKVRLHRARERLRKFANGAPKEAGPER
jgi:RNA polymerase sigma-70 factor (ECF subfamily)